MRCRFYVAPHSVLFIFLLPEGAPPVVAHVLRPRFPTRLFAMVRFGNFVLRHFPVQRPELLQERFLAPLDSCVISLMKT